MMFINDSITCLKQIVAFLIEIEDRLVLAMAALT